MRLHVLTKLCFVVALIGAFALSPGQVLYPQLQVRPQIGAGLEGLADWSKSNAFADVVKQARTFGPPDTPWTSAVAVDANGWPTEDFGAIFIVSEQLGLAGTYKLSLQANQQPTVGLVATNATITNRQWNPTTKVFTADIVYPANATQLMMSFKNTGGGVRWMKLMRPGTTPGQTFTKPFLDHLRRFPVLRFMDWTSTNFNPVSSWSERTRPEHASYARPEGIPWEVCIELANALGKDVWINVPHKADDAYVAELAALLRDTLDPKRKVYLEYSNEVWNWSFSQSQWNLQAAKAEVEAGGSDLNYDNVDNDGYWAARRIAKRLIQMSQIFKSAFGEGRYAAQVRPVLAYQVAWPDLWLWEALQYTADVWGSPSQYFYAAAGAPYFNMGDFQHTEGLTKDQVLDALSASVESYATSRWLEKAAAWTKFHGLRMLAYEGGPDTFGPGSIQAKRAAGHDPRMQTICQRYLNIWFGYGFDTFMWFVAGATGWDTQYGTWGLAEDMTQPNTPKTLAIDWVRAKVRPPLIAGDPIPGAIDARKHVNRGDNWQTQDPYLRYINGGTFTDYLVRVDAGGRYRLVLDCASGPGGVIEVWVNGQVAGQVSIPASGWGTFVDAPSLPIEFKTGLQTLRLKFLTHRGYDVRSLKFTGGPVIGRIPRG